jgi:hypothetical protein
MPVYQRGVRSVAAKYRKTRSALYRKSAVSNYLLWYAPAYLVAQKHMNLTSENLRPQSSESGEVSRSNVVCGQRLR